MMTPIAITLDEVDRRLINLAQHYTPLSTRPFLELAEQLEISENEVISRLQIMDKAGIVSRYGAIYHHKRAGDSTLVAMAVPPENLPIVVDYINSLTRVNHNYQREHLYNLWFVVTASTRDQVDELLDGISHQFDYPILDLPMEKSYFIDLGFPV